VPEPVAVLKEKVTRYVGDLIGDYQFTDRGVVHFRWGSAHLYVECLAWGEEESLVYISVPVLFGLKPSPELYRYVALHADDWYFGHLCLTESDEQAKLWLTHTLLGDYLDVEELKTTLATMSRTADKIDDELKAKLGGDRAHEDS